MRPRKTVVELQPGSLESPRTLCTEPQEKEEAGINVRKERGFRSLFSDGWEGNRPHFVYSCNLNFLACKIFL